MLMALSRSCASLSTNCDKPQSCGTRCYLPALPRTSPSNLFLVTAYLSAKRQAVGYFLWHTWTMFSSTVTNRMYQTQRGSSETYSQYLTLAVLLLPLSQDIYAWRDVVCVLPHKRTKNCRESQNVISRADTNSAPVEACNPRPANACSRGGEISNAFCAIYSNTTFLKLRLHFDSHRRRISCVDAGQVSSRSHAGDLDHSLANFKACLNNCRYRAFSFLLE